MAHRARLAICVVIGAAFWFPHSLVAQTTRGGVPEQEQSKFGYDDPVPVQRPVELSLAALDALSKDKRVASCLKINNLNPQELPANWFVASEIHLHGPDERDLVVLPAGRLPDTPAGEISQNACLVGANVVQMWVLRNFENRFQLVLSQIALGLEILQARTNGLRDIQVGAVVGMAHYDSLVYKFDGQIYKIASRNSQVVGGSSQSLPENFASSIRAVKAKTRVPILLPSTLPNPIGKAKNTVIESVTEDSYAISLYYELGIGDAGFAANFAAQAKPDHTAQDLANVQRTTLAQGLAGFFRPVSCGGSCAPANIWWQQNGILYQIQLELSPAMSEPDQLTALTTAANSAITAGPR